MKSLRDVLIVVVLGGIVIWFGVGVIDRIHEDIVSRSVVVQQASLACLDDEMLCSFSSIESAQEYLDGDVHRKHVEAKMKKAAEQAEFKKRLDALIKQGKSRIRAACREDGTYECRLITDDNLSTFAELLVRKSIGQERAKDLLPIPASSSTTQ